MSKDLGSGPTKSLCQLQVDFLCLELTSFFLLFPCKGAESVKDFAEITLSGICFFIATHIEDTSRVLPSKTSSAPPQVILTPILEISTTNRLSDKMSTVWSHFFPDSTPQLKKNTTTSQTTWCINWSSHTACLRAGSPPGCESKNVHRVLLGAVPQVRL